MIWVRTPSMPMSVGLQALPKSILHHLMAGKIRVRSAAVAIDKLLS